MDARTLQSIVNYLGQERCAREIVLDEKLVTAEELAIMTDVEVYEKLLEAYEVVYYEGENITIVKHADIAIYNQITKTLSR